MKKIKRNYYIVGLKNGCTVYLSACRYVSKPSVNAIHFYDNDFCVALFNYDEVSKIIKQVD